MTLYLQDRAFAARYGNHRSWAWRTLKTDPEFPQPVKLSPGCTRWALADILAWESRKASAKS